MQIQTHRSTSWGDLLIDLLVCVCVSLFYLSAKDHNPWAPVRGTFDTTRVHGIFMRLCIGAI